MSTFLDFFRKYLSPPVFQDKEQTRRAQIVYSIHLALILASLAGILGEVSRKWYGAETTATLLIAIAITILPYWINRRGYPDTAGFILLTIMLSAVTTLLLTGNGIHDIAITALPVLLILSALILNRRGVYFFTILVIGVTGFVVFADVNDLSWFKLNFPTSTSYSDFFIVASILAIAAVSSHFLIDQLVASLNRTRLSEARIRALVENSPDFILEIDLTGKMLFINRLGETYLGKNVREVLPTDQIEYALEVIEKAFTSGEPQAVELQTIAPDGHVSWDSIRIGPVKQGYETTSLTIIMTEITAQKDAEAALSAREELYRLISTITADYVFSTQLEADGRLRLSWVGGGFESITGYTFEEYAARGGWLAALYPEDRAVDAHDMDTLRTNQNVISEVRTFHKNGAVRWVRVYAHPLWDTEHNRLTGIYGAVQDITERKQTEAQRELFIKKIELQNAELERFNYTISHELKSPVVTIKGFLGLLKKDLEENKQDKVQKDFERIAEAADKMGILLSDLLELSRIGRIVNPPEEVDLVKLTKEVLEMLDGRIRSCNVTVHVSPDLPIIYGDPIRLRELFENLIDNAAKYMGEQPNPYIEIGKRESGTETIIYVKDNGMGVEPQFNAKIFGLFEKLSPDSEGTGIGLALVKRIVEVHGGRIWVESEGMSKGSTFCFTLPNEKQTANSTNV